MMFTMDFSISRGHELIISREQGIRRDELDEIELQMLQSSRSTAASDRMVRARW